MKSETERLTTIWKSSERVRYVDAYRLARRVVRILNERGCLERCPPSGPRAADGAINNAYRCTAIWSDDETFFEADQVERVRVR